MRIAADNSWSRGVSGRIAGILLLALMVYFYTLAPAVWSKIQDMKLAPPSGLQDRDFLENAASIAILRMIWSDFHLGNVVRSDIPEHYANMPGWQEVFADVWYEDGILYVPREERWGGGLVTVRRTKRSGQLHLIFPGVQENGAPAELEIEGLDFPSQIPEEQAQQEQWHRLASGFLGIGRADIAAQILEPLVSVREGVIEKHEPFEARRDFALAQLALGNYAEALVHLDILSNNAAFSRRGAIDHLRHMALLNLGEGQIEPAMRWMAEVIGMYPEGSVRKRMLAGINAISNNPATAREILSTSVASEILELSDFYVLRALSELRRKPMALGVARDAVVDMLLHDPENVHAYRLLAHVMDRLHLPGRAAWFRGLVAQGKVHPEAVANYLYVVQVARQNRDQFREEVPLGKEWVYDDGRDTYTHEGSPELLAERQPSGYMQTREFATPVSIDHALGFSERARILFREAGVEPSLDNAVEVPFEHALHQSLLKFLFDEVGRIREGMEEIQRADLTPLLRELNRLALTSPVLGWEPNLGGLVRFFTPNMVLADGAVGTNPRDGIFYTLRGDNETFVLSVTRHVEQDPELVDGILFLDVRAGTIRVELGPRVSPEGGPLPSPTGFSL